MTDKLTDTEKFAVMSHRYESQYRDYKHFASRIGAGSSTVHDWSRRKGKTIVEKFRRKICEVFDLKHTVWVDKFYDEINFLNSLPTYENDDLWIEADSDTMEEIRTKITGSMRALTPREEELIDAISQSGEEVEVRFYLEGSFSPPFLFGLARILKDNNQIHASLEVLDHLLEGRTAYRYVHHNALEHFRAVLLSHDQIRRWDEAIHILRLLYSASGYHLEVPEIVTLMASNYKRKALSDSDGQWLHPDKAQTDLLVTARDLYTDAYNRKKIPDRYYDAVNIAYLNNIIEFLQSGNTDTQAVRELRNDLTGQWLPDPSNWWEVSSHAEILMLAGDVKFAISELANFLESGKHKKFEVETTLRQLAMYQHFVKDEHAEQFASFLRESWGVIK
jgi:hypothetical protein